MDSGEVSMKDLFVFEDRIFVSRFLVDGFFANPAIHPRGSKYHFVLPVYPFIVPTFYFDKFILCFFIERCGTGVDRKTVFMFNVCLN